MGIVSRESERLNHIITDFLNYSREKTYEFAEADVAALLNETLTLIEKKPEIGTKFQISRALQRARNAGARGLEQDQAGVLEFVRQRAARDAGRRDADGWIGRAAVLGADRVSGYGHRAWMRSSGRRFSSRCSRDFRAGRDWDCRSFIRLCRRIAGESAWCRRRIAGRNLLWSCRGRREDEVKVTKQRRNEVTKKRRDSSERIRESGFLGLRRSERHRGRLCKATKTAVKDQQREVARILVVDDEKSICELLEITFRKEGYRVEVAHSVEAAKRKLESQIFDIVISDFKMPGQTGVDLLKLTKEIAPDCFFLLITGVPTVETAIAAINSGADRFVIKDHELGGAIAARGARSFREPEVEERSRISAAGNSPADRARQHHWAEPEHARDFRIDSDDCAASRAAC